MKSMYTQITIKTLYKQGKGISEIAKELGCHRNTVSKIVKGKIKLGNRFG
jgi:predicted transcriptional regulator